MSAELLTPVLETGSGAQSLLRQMGMWIWLVEEVRHEYSNRRDDMVRRTQRAFVINRRRPIAESQCERCCEISFAPRIQLSVRPEEGRSTMKTCSRIYEGNS